MNTKFGKQETEQELRDVFASYHFCRLDQPLVQGFGNFVGKFNMEAYRGEPAKFIVAIEAHLKKLLEEQFGFKIQVKVMFFR